MISPKPHVEHMAPYSLADLTAPEGKKLISLAQNESALPASPAALKAAREAMATSHFYPDPDWNELRKAIGDVHGLDPNGILCGAGSMELIGCLIASYAGPGDTDLSTQYAYAYFRTAALAVGAEYRAAPEQNLTVSIKNILDTVDSSTRVVCIANPGNPTGTCITGNAIRELRDNLPETVLLLVDEAYGEFMEEPVNRVFDLVERGDTVITRTFSKAYALAGMRVGWGLFPQDVSDSVRKLLNPNNVSAPSQTAAKAAMDDQAYMHSLCKEISSRRSRFAERLEDMGLAVTQSHANFVLIQFDNTTQATAANLALRSEGIIMRSMASYDLPDCLRATIAGSDDMDKAADILQSWMDEENPS